ncbi:MAG: hypothetical protein GXO32_02190, partial [Crenarchaeota archaeon]|nr:hypothetical protein [Thermoproteota archaeon]
MPARCLRPLCSATVFSCCAAASLLDTYVELVPHRYCYTPREFVELDLEREAEVTLYPYSELGSARLRYFV